MADPLVTYIHDHLAGARFAVSLLYDLSEQKLDADVEHFAAVLLPEIEADQLVLDEFVKRIGGDSNAFKEVAAWVAQKAGRFKLSLNEPIGIFEAIETLTLGVFGKLALWSALETVRATDHRLKGLDLAKLAARARSQHQQFESLRLKLAMTALKQSAE